MRRHLRRGLLFIVFLLVLQLLVGVTTALADPGWHVVRAGETLFSIGRLYGVNPYYIASLNGLANPDYIQIGQWLYVPGYGGWYTPPSHYYRPYYGWYYHHWYHPGYWWGGWWGWGP
jgi:hypothetical protein